MSVLVYVVAFFRYALHHVLSAVSVTNRCCPNFVWRLMLMLMLTTGASPCRTCGGGCTTKLRKSSCYRYKSDILKVREMEGAKTSNREHAFDGPDCVARLQFRTFPQSQPAQFWLPLALALLEFEDCSWAPVFVRFSKTGWPASVNHQPRHSACNLLSRLTVLSLLRILRISTVRRFRFFSTLRPKLVHSSRVAPFRSGINQNSDLASPSLSVL